METKEDWAHSAAHESEGNFIRGLTYTEKEGKEEGVECLLLGRRVEAAAYDLAGRVKVKPGAAAPCCSCCCQLPSAQPTHQLHLQS